MVIVIGLCPKERTDDCEALYSQWTFLIQLWKFTDSFKNAKRSLHFNILTCYIKTELGQKYLHKLPFAANNQYFLVKSM